MCTAVLSLAFGQTPIWPESWVEITTPSEPANVINKQNPNLIQVVKVRNGLSIPGPVSSKIVPVQDGVAAVDPFSVCYSSRPFSVSQTECSL